MIRKGNRLIMALVFIVLGFIIAFSYERATETTPVPEQTGREWERTYALRNQVVTEEERTRELQQQLREKQQEIRSIEKDLAEDQELFFNLVEDAEKYRMYLGLVDVKGPGVTVTLADSEYDPEDDGNVNDYIVHEGHVFQVINELYTSGATAVSINGQRISQNSYIVCDGPVITVDGVQYPAPFEISAIGDAEVLTAALNLTGGVKDQLVNDNVQFTLQTYDELQMDAIL
ncbi:DUF881 domain-containing protein [Bacillus fonticola]|uniref:DUF881 domain-containing protein n=1 Tax=Bacillus fonticola TaxID=2728853 RepID=UPI002AD2FAA0|nr:DUF881 domain-containing protein [Bacillus fonticola]